MSICPSPVLRKHSHKKLPKVSNDGLAASCSTEAKHSLDTARPRLHASVNLLPIAVSYCTPFWIWSKFKVHTGPYFRLVFAGLLDGGSLGSGTGWAGNGFHVPQVSSSSSSIFVVWLRAVEATPQSFLSLFSVLCQSFQDFWPFQPHSLLSALQLAALLGASCASIMPLRVFPCAQQCKQMQSNARRVDMLASNAMSPPCMWVSSYCPQAFHASGNTTRNNLLSKLLVFAWRYSFGRWRMRFQQLAWIVVLPYGAGRICDHTYQSLISSHKVYDTLYTTRSRKTLFQEPGPRLENLMQSLMRPDLDWLPIPKCKQNVSWEQNLMAVNYLTHTCLLDKKSGHPSYNATTTTTTHSEGVVDSWL